MFICYYEVRGSGSSVKKLIVAVGLSVIVMSACVSVDTQEPERNENNETETTHSIMSIEQAMEDHSFPKETIVHYELKPPYVYVFTTSTRGISVSILKETTHGFGWLDSYDIVQDMSILHADETDMPVLTVVKDTQEPLQDVKVLDEYAKAIRFVRKEVDGFVSHTTFWVHFTDWDASYTTFESLPVHSVEKITE